MQKQKSCYIQKNYYKMRTLFLYPLKQDPNHPSKTTTTPHYTNMSAPSSIITTRRNTLFTLPFPPATDFSPLLFLTLWHPSLPYLACLTYSPYQPYPTLPCLDWHTIHIIHNYYLLSAIYSYLLLIQLVIHIVYYLSIFTTIFIYLRGSNIW